MNFSFITESNRDICQCFIMICEYFHKFYNDDVYIFDFEKFYEIYNNVPVQLVNFAMENYGILIVSISKRYFNIILNRKPVSTYLFDEFIHKDMFVNKIKLNQKYNKVNKMNKNNKFKRYVFDSEGNMVE